MDIEITKTGKIKFECEECGAENIIQIIKDFEFRIEQGKPNLCPHYIYEHDNNGFLLRRI